MRANVQPGVQACVVVDAHACSCMLVCLPALLLTGLFPCEQAGVVHSYLLHVCVHVCLVQGRKSVCVCCICACMRMESLALLCTSGDRIT